ncbi:MAG: sulfotransferase family protein [Cellvibrio sp.]|jgi:hypothetical protein|nr:sulfotransferase family protein [Cellvibrio sp.]
MNKYFTHYCNLISSVAQIELCRQAQSLGELLACIKNLWNCDQLADHELLSEISRLNQTPITDVHVQLAGTWLPYRYQPKQQLVNWLLPVGPATEPFQDETIVRYRQLLFNQIIQPCSSLPSAQQQGEHLTPVKPAGFIFHLSRCGSTLVSGCISELETTCVFSESPLLTELLLDKNLSPDELQSGLCALINLQAAVFPDRPQMIIKWNAWDIFRWELIREIYPQVPVIFLVRDPVEILASHQRLAGRHMAGDRSLAGVNSVFISESREQTLLAWRSGVLAALLGEMNRASEQRAVLRIDYKNLDADGIREICQHFGLRPDIGRINQRMKFHSKSGVVFANDIPVKQAIFSTDDKTRIQQALSPLYTEFFE